LNSQNKEIVDSLTNGFMPESILVTVQNENQLNKISKLPFFEGKQFQNNKTTVFVCKDFTCSLPLETISEIKKQLWLFKFIFNELF